jgi:hypothetical protein
MMKSWEYCKIIDPVKMLGGPTEPTRLVFLGASSEEEQVEEIDTPEHGLARLGREGWELVSHTQLLAMVDTGAAVPVMEVFYLKREMG